MRSLLLTTWQKIKKQVERPIDNQNGSVILIALILLLSMSIIGFSASQTSVTEAFILRNTAIHTQNISLLETAALSIAQRAIIDIPDPAKPFLSTSSPKREPYIIDKDDWKDVSLNDGIKSLKDIWYDTSSSGRVLSSTDGTTFPQWIEPTQLVPLVGTTDSNCANNLRLISIIRGEANNLIRVTLVGWEPDGGTLDPTKPSSKKATVRAEYVSPKYGMMRLELGIRREF